MNNQILARITVSALLALLMAAALALAETSSTDSGIAITGANFVAPSPEKENLLEEWVEISNLGDMEEDMTGWTLEDGQNHTFTFPDFVLAAGSKVKVHTGSGNDTAEDLFWNRNNPIWNNNGDVATLKDASENVISSYPESDGA